MYILLLSIVYFKLFFFLISFSKHLSASPLKESTFDIVGNVIFLLLLFLCFFFSHIIDIFLMCVSFLPLDFNNYGYILVCKLLQDYNLLCKYSFICKLLTICISNRFPNSQRISRSHCIDCVNWVWWLHLTLYYWQTIRIYQYKEGDS